MKEYKISEKQIEIGKRKSLIYAAPIILIALITGFFIGNSGSDYSYMYVTLPLLILIIAGAVIIGMKYGNKINNDSFSSYKIELLDNSIKKYQKNTSVIEIDKSEVNSITEVVNKGITIRTNNLTKYIFISVYVEGYSELKELLSEWMNIAANKRNNDQFLKIISAAGIALGFALVMLCDYSYIVIPVGVVMIIVLVCSLVMNLKNPHLDTRIKKNSLITILPISFILLRVLSFIL